ncbi:MAG: protoporphyrinogen oxidase HemJ [Pseudomonadota bacterium]
MIYLWLKALHIIFVVCWFAGIFYLPRIMVYYAGSDHEPTRRQLAVMARKLYRFVTPLAALAVVLGVSMIAMNFDYYLRATWLWVKLAAVAILIAYHFYCGRLVKALQEDTDGHSHVYFRVFNEVPVLFLFLIVILAVLKPFG